MGGGDLNLKKSWHPSTMKNMEKVWKAEQQKDQEKKRIAELKNEIKMEKEWEDITKYAMDQGVIEKKDNKKLDWMYKGPNQLVNREEYLLGRPIDKSFEQMAQAEREADLNRVPKNHVEYECVPPSLRFFSGNEQVDLARKMQEDPLYAIKKKELETRSQLLKNPVKLKQLKQLLEQQTRKDRSDKKKKKKHKRTLYNDVEDETELDHLLSAKYNELRKRIDEKDLIRSMKKLKRKKKKDARKREENSSSSSNTSSDDDYADESNSIKSKKYKRSNRSKEDLVYRHTNKTKMHDEKQISKNNTEKKSFGSGERNDNAANREIESKRYQERHKNGRQKYDRERTFTKGSYVSMESNNAEKGFRLTSSSKESTEKLKNERRDECRWTQLAKRRHPESLTEEEKERRRQEMMANATWREKEREQNVKKYREEEKRELSQVNRTDSKDFIRKQLVAAAEIGTVASRIKANINNIQRSGRAMDTNFAKR